MFLRPLVTKRCADCAAPAAVALVDDVNTTHWAHD